MTPAINLAKKAKIAFKVHEYTHDPDNAAYGLEAAEKLGLPPTQVFKTLVQLGNAVRPLLPESLWAKLPRRTPMVRPRPPTRLDRDGGVRGQEPGRLPDLSRPRDRG